MVDPLFQVFPSLGIFGKAEKRDSTQKKTVFSQKNQKQS